ncbi:hypothetical protein TTHERM_00669060, partial (macronuclear) [Tetrahymena thermophila SB210]
LLAINKQAIKNQNLQIIIKVFVQTQMNNYLYEQDGGGSKKKSTLRNSNINYNNNFIEESNSKKRISWGGIHTRWFNEQANQNWDVSPQSLRSGSDKSRSIDQSNLTDEKNKDSLQSAQNINKAAIQQNPKEDKQFKTVDRLSIYFKNENDSFYDESMLLPSRISFNNQENVFKRISNDHQHIEGIQKRLSSPANYFKNKTNYQEEDVQLNNDSDSNLLENLDRMSRLSGLFNDSSDGRQNDNSEILQPIQEIQNQISNQNTDQLFNTAYSNQQFAKNSNNNNQINNKDTINFLNDQIQIQFQNSKKIDSSNINTIQNHNQINQQTNYNQNSNQPKIQESNSNQNQGNLLNIQKNDINQNLFQNVHQLEKNQITFKQIDNQTNNQADNSKQDFKRLSEFFLQDLGKTETKKNQDAEEKKLESQKNNKQDKMIFDNQFSQINVDSLDSSKRNFPFSIGFANDAFNESKNSGNDSSSYLLEYLDKVNRLSEVNPPKQDKIDEKNQYKQTAQITPSPLVNDLKNLSFDLEDDENFSRHVNSQVKIAREKKVKIREGIQEIKSGNLFGDEPVEQISNNNNKNINQQKPKSILSSSNSILNDQGTIQSQKNQVKLQLSKMINSENINLKDQVSPKKMSISKSIIPNSSVQKEIKRISIIPKDSKEILQKNTINQQFQQSNKVNAEKNSKEKQILNSISLQSENKENFNQSNQQGQELSNFEAIKSTPMKKKHFNDKDEVQTDNTDDLEQEVGQLENLVVRMPLNSYEKKVILNFLTPGKKSKNLQQFRESILANNNHKQLDAKIQDENGQNQRQNALSHNQILNSIKKSEELLEQLCDSYQLKIKSLEEKVENTTNQNIALDNILRQKQEQIEKEELELQKIEDQINEKRKNLELPQQPEEQNEKEIDHRVIQKENKIYNIYFNQYWQTYQIMINYFGFEYLGKVRDKNNKGDMIAFRFLNKYLCSLQIVKQRKDDKILLVFVKGLVYSIFNSQENTLMNTQEQSSIAETEKQFSSYTELLSTSNIAKITENTLNTKFKNYISQNGNIIEILQFIGNKLAELEEFYKQLKIISTIYSLSNYTYNLSTKLISFTLKLTQFPSKFVKFIISPEQWFNEIQIQVINLPIPGLDNLNEKLCEEVDKSINTQFNSKINSQSCYQKLRQIIEAINVKNAIEQSNNESNTSARLSTSTNLQNTSKDQE